MSDPKLSLASPKEPPVKKTNVKIIDINTVLVPSSMGQGYGMVTIGLGADGMCYQWNSQKKVWQEG